MATYGTDLTSMAVADDDGVETWTELASPYNAGGTPADDDENLIQGLKCQSQTTGTKSGLVFSIVYDYGTNLTFNTDDIVLIWSFYAVISNLETYANGGLRAVIGLDLSNADAYAVGGSDDPYASSWKNVAVDPTKAADYTIGAGNGTSYRYFGMMPYTLANISKGTPHGVDAIRYGRGEIYCTGTGCTFTGMAQYNDYNDVTNGYNRFGLFQSTQGVYLWKGLMSFGQTAISATFSDSNESILIDDTPAAYAAFNKIEINHVSTSVTWTNITITALGTTSPGRFEMVDNATVNKTGCAFNLMNTFIYQSNATLDSCTYNSCGQITHGGADFSSCIFQDYEGTAGTAYMTYAVAADPDGELDNCSFTKGTALTHAIEFDATNTPTTITLRGIDFSGYNAANGNTDSALYFPSTTKSYTVNLVGCTGNISYRVGTGGSVTLVSDPVTTKITVKDADAQTVISGVQILAWVTSGVNFPYLASVTSITGTGTTATVTHNAHGLATNDHIWIQGADQENYVGAYQITVTGVNTYTYTTAETVITSPATGTITATFCFLNGDTDVNGEITDSRVVSIDQPFSYRARKSTSSPLYRQGSGSDIVDSVDGKSITVNLVSDE